MKLINDMFARHFLHLEKYSGLTFRCVDCSMQNIKRKHDCHRRLRRRRHHHHHHQLINYCSFAITTRSKHIFNLDTGWLLIEKELKLGTSPW